MQDLTLMLCFSETASVKNRFCRVKNACARWRSWKLRTGKERTNYYSVLNSSVQHIRRKMQQVRFRAPVYAGCIACTVLLGDDTKRGVGIEDDMDTRPVQPFGQTTRLVGYICR